MATAKLRAEKFVDNLLSSEAHSIPSDDVKPDKLVMELPDWFDEEKYNRGRNFYHQFNFGLALSMLLGFVAVLAVPSILKILVSTRRSNSTYTAYRRYVSTIFHIYSWFDHELKPGTVSWRSLFTVRSRHIQATRTSKFKGIGLVSQRDVALTQFGLFGFAMLKPDLYSVRQMREGDWDAYNHTWRVFGYMLGLEDRYNICRESVEETLEVGQLLVSRVYRPCLENPPEYFEHAARVMLDGLWYMNPLIDADVAIWWAKYLADIPGYIYSEDDRRKLLKQLRQKLEGKSSDTGVDITSLMDEASVTGLPDLPPRLLYIKDYSSIESTPAYKELSMAAKYKLFMSNIFRCIYGSMLGRWWLNIYFRFNMFCQKYFPYLAFFRFGIKASLVNMFEEDPKDDAKLILNSEYRVKRELAWYERWFSEH